MKIEKEIRDALEKALHDWAEFEPVTLEDDAKEAVLFEDVSRLRWVLGE